MSYNNSTIKNPYGRSTDNKILVTLNKATLNCLLKKVEKNQLTLQLKHCH